MNYLCQPLSAHIRRRRHHHHQIRTLYEGVSTLQCPRDRGLDHAVERERHLRPLLDLKNIILSEPSKSIPLPLITELRETLRIPIRPIEFIRKYPSIFQEFHPGSLNIQPHIKLTPESISLNSEEDLLYQSVDYKHEIARRLLKLLMIGRINKIPILLLERLKWELGLPPDYEKDVIPEFPDYFRVIDGKGLGDREKILELVCWTEEFAISEMEKKGAKDGTTQFILQYSKGFEMDKKYKKWVDEWQKLPYISPYENAMHLAAKTDESDKWAVSVLHELLNIFVGKKAQRDSLLYLGEYLGLRSRFKLAFLQHPGIFYVSSKIGTHTVVLREGYKRGALIERHPLVDMRFKYVQLMNVNVDADDDKSKRPEKKSDKGKGSEGKESEGDGVDNAEMSGSSDEDEDDYDDGSDDENSHKRRGFNRKGTIIEEGYSRRNVSRRFNGKTDENRNYKGFESEDASIRGRLIARDNFEVKNSRKNMTRMASGRRDEDYHDRGFEGENGARGKFRRNGINFDNLNYGKNVMRRTRARNNEDGSYRGFEGENAGKRGGFRRKGENFEGENARRNVTRRENGRRNEENVYKNSTRFSGRSNSRGGDMNIPRLRTQKPNFPRNNDGI